MRMIAKNLEIGDLVWVKMKNLQHWPAKIVPPQETKTLSSKKSEHYVYFFGSGKHDWVLDEHIVSHSVDMINSCKKNKANTAFQNAIDEIKKAALEGNSLEVPNAENDLSQASASEPKKKVQKIKDKNAIVKASKRQLSDNEKSDDSILSRASKVSKLADDVPSTVSVSPTAEDGSRIAVIRPLDLPTEYMEPTDKKIGFLGLGIIGRGIVKNLLNSKHHVIIWNRSPEKYENFQGVEKGELPSDVIEAADITFCCVSDPEAVKEIVFGRCGVLDGLKKFAKGQKGYVEMSSIDANTSQEIAEAITTEGGKYLEAPIIGNGQLADEGAFTILASGDRDLFNDSKTCFNAMASHAYYVSCDVGESSKFNLILSMLKGTICGALGEAMALAKSLQVSQKEVLKVLQSSGLGSKMIFEKGQAIIDQNFSIGTPLKHQQKDLHLALCTSNSVKQPLLVTSSANELYKQAKRRGNSELDMAAVYESVKY